MWCCSFSHTWGECSVWRAEWCPWLRFFKLSWCRKRQLYSTVSKYPGYLLGMMLLALASSRVASAALVFPATDCTSRDAVRAAHEC